MTLLLRLFWEFFKTGLFAVGGGMATIPFLRDMGVRTAWFTDAQLTDMIAVSESTPGPIGVNMATYVGYTTAGIPGALCATFGLVLPSLVIILVIAEVLNAYRQNRFVTSAFYGLRPASMGLISAAGLSVAAAVLLTPQLYAATGVLADLFDVKAILLAAALFLLTRVFKKLHPVCFIALAAVAGIVFDFAA